MKSKIGIITTGGTIGSLLGANSISVDPTENGVRQEINRAASTLGLQFVLTSAVNINSEELNPSHWSAIISQIDAMRNKGISRIVITHGTDTLAFTASAIAGIYGDANLRICITGSYTSPSDKTSDAGLAIAAALEAVASDKLFPGVFVAFRKDKNNKEAIILPALSLKPMDFDGLAFSASYGDIMATYRPNTGLTSNLLKKESFGAPFSDLKGLNAKNLQKAAGDVALIQLYPGIDKQAFRSISKNRQILILSPFHSGTGPSFKGSGLVDFLSNKPAELKVFLAQFPLRLIPKPYISTLAIHDAGCEIVRDLQPHTLYAWAVLARAVNMSGNNFCERLLPWLIGDDILVENQKIHA